MLRHIVMWTINDQINGNSKLESSLIIKEKLEALQGQVDGLIDVKVGIDVNQIESNYDVVLISDFTDEDALAAYQIHPLHKEAGAFIKSVASSRSCVDYML